MEHNEEIAERVAKRAMERIVSDLFGFSANESDLLGQTTATASEGPGMLTVCDLLKAKEGLSRIYYIDTEMHPAGKITLVREGRFHPEYIVVNPDDLAFIESELPGFKLSPIEDHRPIGYLIPSINYRSRWSG